jgi:hypothetical protein
VRLKVIRLSTKLQVSEQSKGPWYPMRLPPNVTHFGKVEIAELIAAVNELRSACREEGTPRIQAAIDRAEPWFDPIFTTSGKGD